MKNKKLISESIKIFWIFILASMIGCIVETIVCLVQKGHFELRQGLIYGPFIPVYGAGAIVYYILVPKIKNTKLIFPYCAIIGGCVEYLFSYYQENWFGTVSWDYSDLIFNINGRTSMLHCIYWGIAGVIFMRYIYPKINKIEIYLEKINFRYITGILAIFMVVNIAISCLAGNRQEERIKKIPADSKIDYFLDKYYPDQRMDNIFANKKIVSF